MSHVDLRSKCDQIAERYILKDVRGLTDGELKGSGAYGVVRTVSVGGTTCIAKRLHDILQDSRVPREDRESVKQKFYEECKMLSELRHPNIVHFVGVHYDSSRLLSLVMEALHSDLRGFFLQKEPNLSVKLGIMLDVSYGLLYLHSRQPTPIIHRDLNLGNILLTQDLRAKIADLGVSSYLVISKSQTMAPGAWDYMPPEALCESPTYDTSLDIFSFGQVSLCIGNHKNVTIPLLPSVGTKAQSPIKRRKRHLDSLGHKHCLYPLLVDCLQELPRKRPATTELCDRLQKRFHVHKQADDELSREKDSKSTIAKETTSGLMQKIAELEAENKELKGIADAEKAQAMVFKTDFEIERSDRVKAHDEIERYKFQLANLQEKLIQIEEKYQRQLGVLKTANSLQAEELRNFRLKNIFCHDQYLGNAQPVPPLPPKVSPKHRKRTDRPVTYTPTGGRGGSDAACINLISRQTWPSFPSLSHDHQSSAHSVRRASVLPTNCPINDYEEIA